MQVADVFESAEKLGLKVVRMWAFNDGAGWNALQPSIGQVNEHVLRCGRLLPCHSHSTACHTPQRRRTSRAHSSSMPGPSVT